MKDWYNALEERERNLVLYGSIVVGIILIWLLIIKPLYNKKASLNKSIESQTTTLATMQEQRTEVEILKKQKTKKKPVGNPQQRIDRSLVKWGLKDKLERMQQQGKDIVVNLKDANADRGFQFLYDLENTHALTLTSIAINGDDERNGIVDFRLTIGSEK